MVSRQRATTMAWLVAVLVVCAITTVAGEDNCTRIGFLPGPFVMSPVKGACSGRGTCVGGAFCACDEGFSGRADFVNTAGADCQSNRTVIVVMHSVSIFFTLLYLALSWKRIMLRIRQYQETAATKRSQNKTYGLRQNRGMLSIALHTCLVVPAMLAFCINKLATDESNIGLDAVPTVAFFMAKGGMYLAIYAFQPALIASVVGNVRGTRTILRRTYGVSRLLSGMGVMVSTLPFITLFASDGNDDTAVVVYFLFMLGSFLQIAGLGIQAYDTKVKIVRVLDASLLVQPSERVQDIRAGLVKMQTANIIQASMLATIFAFFLVYVPTMMNTHEYIVPIFFMTYAILGKKLAFTTVADRSTSGSKGTTTADGSSIQMGQTSFASSWNASKNEGVPESTATQPSDGVTARDFDASTLSAPKQPPNVSPGVYGI